MEILPTPSKPMVRVTQRDLSKEANVHVSTVSLALRNSPLIPEATRNRILALAAARGYKPDPMIQRFIAAREAGKVARDRGVIAYVRFTADESGTNSLEGPGELYLGANYSGLRRGYRLEMFQVYESERSQERLFRTLATRGIRGVLFETKHAFVDAGLSTFKDRFSVVTVGAVPRKRVFNAVAPDIRGDLALLLEVLAGQGKRRIGLCLVNSTQSIFEGLQIRSQFLEACVRRGFSCHDAERRCLLTLGGAPSAETPWLREAFRTWIEGNDFDAVVTRNEGDLIRMKECCEGSSQSPEFAFFGIPAGGRLPGVVQNMRALGALAMEVLSDQLRRGHYGPTLTPKTITLPGQWSTGGSGGKPDEGFLAASFSGAAEPANH